MSSKTVTASNYRPAFEHKLTTADALRLNTAGLPRPWVLTNGVFDVLHRGHVSYLAQAQSLGASLIVAINDDDSVRRLSKGAERPLNPALDRAMVLAALGCVDAVIVFSENTAESILADLQPEVYAKGGDYALDQLPEAAVVAGYGGVTQLIPIAHARSTSDLVQHIKKLAA